MDIPQFRFAKGDLSIIVAALPRGVGRHRKTLLPRILHEWGTIDLPDHLSRKARQPPNPRQKSLIIVKDLANQLGIAIQKLSADEHFLLATSITARKMRRQIIVLTPDQFAQAIAELKRGSEWLVELAAGANAANSLVARKRGRPRLVAHYLIMMDLAAIFEYLTGERAERLIRGEDHSQRGTDYGSFWNFAEATWAVIFKSTDGLKAAIKHWASYRIRYGETSAIIANIDLRHPRWGIFSK